MNDLDLADLPTAATRENAHPGSSDGTHAEQQADLERLAAELSTRGCKTVLIAGEGRQPFLDALHPEYPGALAARVRAQADYFWWPWGEMIADRDQPAAAAEAIARALRMGGQP
jgi:hypothetical protein